jgi:hypothetical protein
MRQRQEGHWEVKEKAQIMEVAWYSIQVFVSINSFDVKGLFFFFGLRLKAQSLVISYWVSMLADMPDEEMNVFCF